jgi:hypothetical protein
MNNITFDRLDFVKIIEGVGFPREQAEGIAKAVSSLRVEENSFVSREDAAKHDLEFAILQKEITDSKATVATKADLKTEIAIAKLDIIKWMIGGFTASTIAIITTIIKLLH